MRPDELTRQRVQRVEPQGPLSSPHRLVLWGLQGAGAYVLGIQVHDTYTERRRTVALNGTPPETEDQLRIRVMETVVPNLPPEALRDRHGAAVGYFVYEGLFHDYCESMALEQGAR